MKDRVVESFAFLVGTRRSWVLAGKLGFALLFLLAYVATLVLPSITATVGSVLLLGVLANAAYTFATARWSTKVDVGLDGVRIQRARSDRFVPFHDLEVLTATSTDITVRVGRAPLERWNATERVDAFVAQVARARQNAVATATPLAVSTAASGFDYRSAAYPNDVLLRIVEDATQVIASRVAAASALRSCLDIEARERVRVAAATTASPELRQTLDELASLPEANVATVTTRAR
jgi:hypothetical protein